MKRPHRFIIEINPIFTAKTTYLLEDGWLVVRSGMMDHRRAIPTLAQWTGFWRLCELIELWKWKDQYDDLMARDGQEWRLHIAKSKSIEIRSTGVSSYPALENCTISSSTSDRFGLLLEFIDLTLMNPRTDWRNVFAYERDFQ